jgi:hypothetical protein
MKENLKKKYTRILKTVMKSKLIAINTITAIRALVIPVLRYSFSIIDWKLEEIRKICMKTRNVLTKYKMLHQKADINRLYRKERGSKKLVTNQNNM